MRTATAMLALLGCTAAAAEDLPTVARRLADGLAQSLAASPERATVKKVAVAPFASAPDLTPELAPQAAEAFGQRFAGAAKVAVLDAQALRALLGEQRLKLLLAGGSSEDAELAGRAGAQVLASGALTAEGNRIRLQVKLTSLPSGRLLGSAQGTADGAGRPAAATPAPAQAAAAADSRRIDVAMRQVADGLAAGFARLPGNARYHRLAVLAFGEVGERAQKQKLGTIVAAELATDLRRDHGLLLVERERLGQVLGELRLQQMVAPDAGQTAQIGKLADAQAIVIGSVAEAGDRYLITSRIVSTQTGESLAAESAGVQAAGLVALASDSVVLRSRSDAALRSLVVPGLGQTYNRQTVKGIAFAGATAGLLGTALYFHLSGSNAYSAYKKATTQASAAQHYDDARSADRARNWLLVGGGAAWAVNVLDAYLSGVDGEAALSGGLAAVPVAVPGGGGLALAGRW